MTIETQLATLRAWMYKYQSDAEMKETFEAIKKSLKRLIALDTMNKKKTPKYAKYQEFVNMYDLFCQAQSGVGAKMDGVQGKAMNSIIKFLVEQSKSKDEAGALAAWQYILTYWTRLSNFIQKQIGLSQINKNLPEILTQMKNYGKANSKGSTAADDIRNAAR